MREEQTTASVTESGPALAPRIWVDVAAYSGAIAAGVAGTLAVAVSLALDIPIRFASIGLAICGTSVVYNIDRLRDLERDRVSSPRRHK